MTSHAAFARALLDPDAAIPFGIIDPQGRPAPKRFSVYRNNVASSLIRALEAAFPTVQKLVGEAFFGAMAVAFLRAHPPRSPQLMLYGAAMPDFLAAFPPVAHLGYLPDIARLDQAMRESYHAADMAPLAPKDFSRLFAQDIAALRLQLAPSLRLVRSGWPIHAIWVANHQGGPTPLPASEDVVVLRPAFDPLPQLLPPGGAALLGGLLDGRSLGESAELAGQDHDLTTTLGLLITGHAITGVSQ